MKRGFINLIVAIGIFFILFSSAFFAVAANGGNNAVIWGRVLISDYKEPINH